MLSREHTHTRWLLLQAAAKGADIKRSHGRLRDAADLLLEGVAVVVEERKELVPWLGQ
jgi:hypothetical protein